MFLTARDARGDAIAGLVIKMMGLGLAVAIAVDATVIRGIVVPATMVLLGRAGWWTLRAR